MKLDMEAQRERDKTFAENERLGYQKIDDDAQIGRLKFVYEEDQATLTQQAATIRRLEKVLEKARAWAAGELLIPKHRLLVRVNAALASIPKDEPNHGNQPSRNR